MTCDQSIVLNLLKDSVRGQWGYLAGRIERSRAGWQPYPCEHGDSGRDWLRCRDFSANRQTRRLRPSLSGVLLHFSPPPVLVAPPLHSQPHLESPKFAEFQEHPLTEKGRRTGSTFQTLGWRSTHPPNLFMTGRTMTGEKLSKSPENEREAKNKKRALCAPPRPWTAAQLLRGRAPACRSLQPRG